VIQNSLEGRFELFKPPTYNPTLCGRRLPCNKVVSTNSPLCRVPYGVMENGKLRSEWKRQKKKTMERVLAFFYTYAHRVPLLRSPVWGAQQRCAVAHRATVPLATARKRLSLHLRFNSGSAAPAAE
jgi:hypothetical protein